MKRVKASELEYPGDGFYYLNQIPFTGIAITYSKGNWEKSAISYEEGLRSGPTVEWYQPGQKMIESSYFKGALHGRAQEWHRNGQLAEDGEYEYGITLWEKNWDENGVLKKDYVLKESDQNYQSLLKYRQIYGKKLS